MEEVTFQGDREYRELFYKVFVDVCENSKFEETKQYIQHGDTSVYEHSINVAYSSMLWAIRIGCTEHLEELIRGALLHDYFLYDWHESDASHRLHGFTHPKKAFQNAEEHFELTDREKNIIVRHMFPLTPVPPTSTEAYLVCMADKMCSVQETFHTKELRRRFLQVILEAHQWRQEKGYAY